MGVGGLGYRDRCPRALLSPIIDYRQSVRRSRIQLHAQVLWSPGGAPICFLFSRRSRSCFLDLEHRFQRLLSLAF